MKRLTAMVLGAALTATTVFGSVVLAGAEEAKVYKVAIDQAFAPFSILQDEIFTASCDASTRLAIFSSQAFRFARFRSAALRAISAAFPDAASWFSCISYQASGISSVPASGTSCTASRLRSARTMIPAAASAHTRTAIRIERILLLPVPFLNEFSRPALIKPALSGFRTSSKDLIIRRV